MNNKKLLSAAILLALAKSALGIEVEPNNDSSRANKLGKENVGKLNRASDVDFFSIDSCVKDDKKQCVKYTADDEKLNPLNKAGTDKRREEVSISFTCSNKSSASPSGWFLGVHDSNGELQETYPVKPDDCIISDKTSGAFNFKFPSLDSPNYYVSVVADCQVPIYNTIADPKDPTKTIVSINKFVAAALTTIKDITAAKKEISNAQTEIENFKTKLLPPTLFEVISSNAHIKNLNDAITLANDITSVASPNLTAATNITAAISTAKAVSIAAKVESHYIERWQIVLDAKDVANNPAIQKAIEAADAALATATTNATQAATAATAAGQALTNATADRTTARAREPQIPADITAANNAIEAANLAKTGLADGTGTAGTDGAKITADLAKTNAENVKKAADNVKTVADKAVTDALAEFNTATTRQTEATAALADAVKFLNDTVNANILAANTAENFGKRFDSACKDNYNVGIYTIKDNPDNEIKRLEDITSKEQKNLGLEQSGQISSIDDMDIYVVDSDGTADVPLLFTCSALAARQTNDWKVSIYNDANGLVSSTLINGSSCGSVFIGDKGGQSVKLPKGSQRYYLAVESACASSTKKDCVVDTSEYSILRDVDKVYSGKLAKKTIDVKTKISDLKLTNCGLNNNAVISIHTENVNLVDAVKLPINVQIGSTACRILTPELLAKDTIIGSVADASEIIDSTAKTKDSAAITLADCGSDAKSKVTLTGAKLDLVNLMPNEIGVIPIKVSIGDFQCGTNGDVFSINNATAETTYSIVEAVKVKDSLVSAKNIGTSQTNKLKSLTDIHVYYADTSSTTENNFEFSCPSSKRFTNDWTLLIYDSAKKLQSTKVINGSDCGTGKNGDKGALKFSALTNTTRTYFAVKSACETEDSSCELDSSQYEITRIISTTAPCFYNSCTKNADPDAPKFGAK